MKNPEEQQCISMIINFPRLQTKLSKPLFSLSSNLLIVEFHLKGAKNSRVLMELSSRSVARRAIKILLFAMSTVGQHCISILDSVYRPMFIYPRNSVDI